MVEELERTRRTDDMVALDGATRAAVASLQGKLESVENRFREYRVSQDIKLQLLIDSHEKLTAAILRLAPVDHGENGDPPPPPPVGPLDNQPFSDSDPEEEPEVGRIEEEEVEESKEEEEREEIEDQDGADEAPPVAAAAAAIPARIRPVPSRGRLVERQFQAQANLDARQVIQGLPLQPPLKNKKCPATWTACLHQWQGNNLSYWEGHNKGGWDGRVLRAYNKRLSIQKELIRYRTLENEEGDATTPICTLELAARLLDELRVQRRLNLTDHLNMRRKENPAVGNRNRGGILQPPRQGRPAPPRRPTQQQTQQQTGGGGEQRRDRGHRTHQERRPAADVADDGGAAFAAEFTNAVLPAAALERDRLRQQQTNLELEQERAGIAAEVHRLRTTGSLMYRETTSPDRRNQGDMSAFGRADYNRRHFGQS